MWRHEKQKLEQGVRYVIGCDEVGRGSLAGPVVAAAVCFDAANEGFLDRHHEWLKEIRDSKELAPVKRSTLARLIEQYSLGWGIGAVSPTIIDRINIHQATLRAMRLAVLDLAHKVSFETSKENFIFVDGRFIIPGLNLDQEALINGDSLVISISAASIVAKVYRDGLMVKLHKKFPGYNLARHKGYGTFEHIEALKRQGLSPIHRASFCGKIA